jgi:nucleoside-diphosphate-sugar epimerase
MDVFVTGATGVIGRRAVRQLLNAGHQVTGLARSEDKANALGAEGANAAMFDPFNRSAVIAATAGFDALVNLATHIPTGRGAARKSKWAENDKIRRVISGNIAAAAAAHRTPRLIQESIVLVYDDGRDEWIDESSPTNPAPTLKSAMLAEQNAIGTAEGSTEPVVLRFGLFYAPDARHTLDQIAMARRGMAPVIGGPSGFIPTIDADDAAAAVVAALAAPEGVYNVVDDAPLTRGQFAEALGAVVGNERASFTAARASGLIGDNRTGGMKRSLRVANDKLKRASAWSPRWPSPKEGLEAAVARSASATT